ncbi:esterase family protein [Nocardioides KLBMP 9356]|uniref:Esterase family protein n=1 Tax=Nocardioides potassii TaxID=2911371 RepID=A0ABS9HBS4_9ACTN|nr:alpha/beta hydrolase-fold protein [Nocardioides potassii]MCF6377742.1 esterase family protein [Nocardioides potassii]
MGHRVPYTSLPIDQTEVTYEHGPDSGTLSPVPRGRTTQLSITGSRAFPGTTRSLWVHAPAAAPTGPLPVVVFQDGAGFLDPDDEMRAAVVLDNLVAAAVIPPVVGVFVDPGNRNAEYDAPDATYADFLVDEVLPVVGELVPVSDRPEDRAICGFSSGGSAAFTAAWQRPDAFGKVIGLSSSFPQVAADYPRLVASEPVRPIRVLLQVGHRDLGWDEVDDNWVAANLELGAALLRRGYDVRLVVGDGAHDGNHGGVVLPDALRWLWR